MKFTPSEWEIIVHRLETVDPIAQALTDYPPDDAPAPFTDGEVTAAIHELLEAGANGLDNDTPLTLSILRDCCDSSTYFADIEDAVFRGELSRGKMLSAFKAADRLDDKLKTYTYRQ